MRAGNGRVIYSGVNFEFVQIASHNDSCFYILRFTSNILTLVLQKIDTQCCCPGRCTNVFKEAISQDFGQPENCTVVCVLL